MEKEHAEIDHAINIFSEWMAKRMLHKKDAGFVGWQQPDKINAKKRLLEKAKKIATTKDIDDKDLVDIANFSMMLFMEEWGKVFPFKYNPNKKG